MKLEFSEVQKLARAVELLERPGAHIRGEFGQTANGAIMDADDCSAFPTEVVKACGVGALRAAGVKQATLEAFSQYLVDRSRAIREFTSLPKGEPVPADEAEDVIIDTNDDMPNGPKLIRKYMRDFIHAQVKSDVAAGPVEG